MLIVLNGDYLHYKLVHLVKKVAVSSEMCQRHLRALNGQALVCCYKCVSGMIIGAQYSLSQGPTELSVNHLVFSL